MGVRVWHVLVSVRGSKNSRFHTAADENQRFIARHSVYNCVFDTFAIGSLVFYLIGGVAAAGLQILSAPLSQVPMVGASGAIAAVLGAYIVLWPNNRVTTLVFLGFLVTTIAVPAVVVLGLWIFLQFINASAGGMTHGGGGVAYWAHIGGFAAGVIGILLLGGRRLVRSRRYDRRFHDDWG